MLLRSITTHVKQQNWFAVFLDFMIVVVGILIAFQITNWNEGRIERAKQEVYLERLHNDFVNIRARLNSHLNVYQDAIDGGDYLLTLIKSDKLDLTKETIDHDMLEKGIVGLTSYRVSPGPPATYIEMVSEGQLSKVRQPALRDKLAAYDRLLGIVQEVSRVVIDKAIQQEPIFHRHVDLNFKINADNVTGMDISHISYDLAGMRADKDFVIAVTLLQQSAMNSLGQRNFQLQLIDEIMHMLNEEIK
jgi:hypothetical protein